MNYTAESQCETKLQTGYLVNGLEGFDLTFEKKKRRAHFLGYDKNGIFCKKTKTWKVELV
mgnify:CR=1 FL=1